MLSTHLSERGQLKENRVARVNWRHRRKCVTEITSKSFDGFNWFTFIEHWTFLLELDGFDCGYLLHVNEINWVFTIEISFWRTFELSLDKKNFNAEILCEIWYNFFFQLLSSILQSVSLISFSHLKHKQRHNLQTNKHNVFCLQSMQQEKKTKALIELKLKTHIFIRTDNIEKEFSVNIYFSVLHKRNFNVHLLFYLTAKSRKRQYLGIINSIEFFCLCNVRVYFEMVFIFLLFHSWNEWMASVFDFIFQLFSQHSLKPAQKRGRRQEMHVK